MNLNPHTMYYTTPLRIEWDNKPALTEVVLPRLHHLLHLATNSPTTKHDLALQNFRMDHIRYNRYRLAFRSRGLPMSILIKDHASYVDLFVEVGGCANTTAKRMFELLFVDMTSEPSIYGTTLARAADAPRGTRANEAYKGPDPYLI